MLYRSLATFAVLSAFTGSVTAQGVSKLRAASIDTWVVILVGVVLTIIVGVGTFLSPKRSHED